ncbi:vacuolar protein sorting/targeting protein PEP1, partial [Spiromyces aspiralis]
MDAEIISFQYFKHSPHIMAHTAANEAHVSLDEGATWRPLTLPDAPATPISDVLAILRNPYFEGYAVIVTMGHVHYITADEGRSAKAIHVPDSPHAEARAAFAFHPEQPEWMLYSARSESCPSQLAGPGGCPAKAYISRDLGDTWDELMAMVGPTGCNFMRTDKLLTRHPRSVVCQVPREHGDRVDRSENPYDIVVVEDVFHRNPKVLLEGALDFGTIDKYLIMTRSTNNEKHLQMFITEDGEQVAVAHFPGEKHHTDPAYTLLPPSKSGGVLMLHVTKSLVPSQEWGAIYASNSNGTYFRLSLENVNRDEQGQVDFERIESLEGAALANVVANAGDLEASRRTREARKRYLSARSADKQLRTVMTMDNGASWHYLNPPSRDSEGRRYPCRSSAPSDGSCALHLHGYTELFDPVNIYSGSGAPGVLIGMGNVGSYLGSMRNASTFLSRDGGHVWTEIQKGAYWHEIGDHGVIL